MRIVLAFLFALTLLPVSAFVAPAYAAVTVANLSFDKAPPGYKLDVTEDVFPSNGKAAESETNNSPFAFQSRVQFPGPALTSLDYFRPIEDMFLRGEDIAPPPEPPRVSI